MKKGYKNLIKLPGSSVIYDAESSTGSRGKGTDLKRRKRRKEAGGANEPANAPNDLQVVGAGE